MTTTVGLADSSDGWTYFPQGVLNGLNILHCIHEHRSHSAQHPAYCKCREFFNVVERSAQ